jgi:hypothetical protein
MGGHGRTGIRGHVLFYVSPFYMRVMQGVPELLLKTVRDHATFLAMRAGPSFAASVGIYKWTKWEDNRVNHGPGH